MNRRELITALLATPIGVATGAATLNGVLDWSDVKTASFFHGSREIELTIKVPALTAIQYWGQTFPGEIYLNEKLMRVLRVEVIPHRDELVLRLEPA